MTIGDRFEGWRLVGWTALAVALLAAGLVALRGAEEDGIRSIVRSNAQIAVILFSSVFAASALARRWPNAGTLWLRRNRRFLGVSFAAAPTGHLASLGLRILARARRARPAAAQAGA
jgi:hypothetical protein